MCWPALWTARAPCLARASLWSCRRKTRHRTRCGWLARWALLRLPPSTAPNRQHWHRRSSLTAPNCARFLAARLATQLRASGARHPWPRTRNTTFASSTQACRNFTASNAQRFTKRSMTASAAPLAEQSRTRRGSGRCMQTRHAAMQRRQLHWTNFARAWWLRGSLCRRSPTVPAQRTVRTRAASCWPITRSCTTRILWPCLSRPWRPLWATRNRPFFPRAGALRKSCCSLFTSCCASCPACASP